MHIHHFTLKSTTWLLICLLLNACASTIPLAIREAPANNPSLEQVRAQGVLQQNGKVRWGGTLLEIENRAQVTHLTILAAPLSKGGRPMDTGKDAEDRPGRFIAIVPQFLEPSVYRKDRKITVSGILLRTEVHKVGEYAYTYPMVQVEEHYLWPILMERPDDYGYPWMYYHPWLYDPWYYPRHPLGYPSRE